MLYIFNQSHSYLFYTCHFYPKPAVINCKLEYVLVCLITTFANYFTCKKQQTNK